MKNFTQRLLLFVFGIPLLFFLIVCFQKYSHAGWLGLIALVTFLSSYEAVDLFIPGYRAKRRHLIPLAAVFIALSPLLSPLLPQQIDPVPLMLSGTFLVLLIIELFTWSPEDPHSFPRHSLGISAALLYPGFLMTYPSRFTEIEHTVPAILLFLLLNFGNDTFAYIFGMLFGKNSPKIAPVSPKKSLIGYIGGILGSLLVGFLFYRVYPELFSRGIPYLFPFFLLIALSANIGDLVESAFKRGVSKKDSGRLMPGRGGLLDSIDSLLFSAPFFYYIGIILLN